MNKEYGLKAKNEILRRNFGDRKYFTIAAAAEVLQEKRTTLGWILWKLKDQGFIRTAGRGLYTYRGMEKDLNLRPSLSPYAKNVYNVLMESGFDFFISGLDILSIFMHHLPERYPVLLYIRSQSMHDIQSLLSDIGVNSFDNRRNRGYTNFMPSLMMEEKVIIGETREFSYQERGLASFEKAFVDIYFEISRNNFPYHIQELARIYLHMSRRYNINLNRMTKIASVRNIHPDIRYIIENEKISRHSYKFVEIIKSLKERDGFTQ